MPATNAAVPSDRQQAAWTSYGGGSDNRYWNSQETAITSNTVGSLRERFAITVPHDFPEEPVVADGKLFVSHGKGVTAYSADDGRQLWSQPRLGTSPEMVWMDGTLYVSRGNLNRPSTLYAFTPDGKLRWSFTNRDVVFGTLVAADGTIVVSGQSRDYTANKVFAFDSDGTRLWAKDGLQIPTYASVVDGAGQIFLQPWQGSSPVARTTAVDLETGEQRWSIDRALQPRAAHSEAGSIVTVEEGLSDGRLLSLDDRTGKPRWDVATSSFATYNTVAVDREHAYQAGNYTGVTARDLATGQLDWKAPVSEDTMLGSPVVAADLVYVIASPDEHDTLVAYHSATGKQVWSYRIGTEARLNPVVVNGSLYLVDGHKIRVLQPAG